VTTLAGAPRLAGRAARALNDVAHVLESAHDPAPRLRRVLEVLARLVPYERCAVLLAHPVAGLRFAALPAPADGQPGSEQPAARAALERLLALLGDHDPADAAGLWSGSAGTPLGRSHLAVPLVGLDRVLGILAVGRDAPEAYGDEDLGLLSVVASQVGAYLAALQARDELLAVVTHDLKNPLASILGYGQMLRRHAARGGPLPPEAVAEAAAQIETGARRIIGMLDDLLGAARLRAGEAVQLDRRPTDLVALAERVARAQGRADGGDRDRVVVEAAESELVGAWDAALLERVLDNLVGNALKYSPDGGDVVVRVERDAAWAVVSVRDRGIGIPPADLPRVFEPFHRGANAVGRFDGAGVGLANARHVVEVHGGTIAVASTEGEGSTVTVRLPLARP
jgi:signal transduction histidine kinase